MAHFASQERVKHRLRGVAVSLRRAQISGELIFGEPDLTGLFDLREAHIRMINDGGGRRWTQAGIEPGHLLLDGLTYEDLDDVEEDGEIEGNRKSDIVSRRLDWLALQYPDRGPSRETFMPQPYERLASLFAEEGDEHSRRRVQIARRDLQRQHGGLNQFEKLVQSTLKAVSQYGYSPARAMIFMISYMVFGAAIAALLEANDALILLSTDTDPRQMFDPIIYAIDAAIPIIDLNQDSVWTLNPTAFRYGWAAQAMGVAKGLYEIIGMLLISITVLTLSGALREKD